MLLLLQVLPTMEKQMLDSQELQASESYLHAGHTVVCTVNISS